MIDLLLNSEWLINIFFFFLVGDVKDIILIVNIIKLILKGDMCIRVLLFVVY